MKTRLIVAAMTFGINIGAMSQDAKIQDNITSAIIKGIEYSQDGNIKTVINISKIEYYYKWIKSGDTLSAMDQIAGWDFTSLNKICNSYRNENLNFAEQISKCHLIAEKLKELQAGIKSDSMLI